jgi:hypothetical protein
MIEVYRCSIPYRIAFTGNAFFSHQGLFSSKPNTFATARTTQLFFIHQFSISKDDGNC